MLTNKITQKTEFKNTDRVSGDTIEMKIRKMMDNKEPMKGMGTGLLYTPRKDGVLPETDIRTDRFEIAVEATSRIAASYAAKREERAKIGEPESTEGKGPDSPTT